MTTLIHLGMKHYYCVFLRGTWRDSVGLERCWWCVPGKLQTTAGSGWSSWPDRGSSPWRGWAQTVHRAAHSLRRRWSEPCSNPWTTDPEPRWRSPSEPPRYWPEPQKPAHTHTGLALISADKNTQTLLYVLQVGRRCSSDGCWMRCSSAAPDSAEGRSLQEPSSGTSEEDYEGTQANVYQPGLVYWSKLI